MSNWWLHSWANIENLDAKLESNKQRDNEKQDNEQNLLIKWQFNLLDDIIKLKDNLALLVSPEESEQIQGRLFTKYKSNINEFDFETSLDEVFFGKKKDINPYGYKWISLEWLDRKEIFDKVKSPKIIQENKQINTAPNKETVKQETKNNYEWFDTKSSKAIAGLLGTKTASSEKLNAKLPENYDSVERAPDSCKKAVWETCDTVSGLVNSEEIINEKFDKLSEHTINDPKTSIMNRLVESWELSGETNEAINNNIASDGEFDNKFEKSLKNTDDISKIQWKLKLIPKSQKAVPVQNISSFKEDFPDLADIAINWNKETPIEGKEEFNSHEISAYSHISENYIKIWDTPEDREKNYSTAIKTASANLLKNDTVIKRDTVAFKQSLNNIQSWNAEQQFEWLVSLISIKETDKTDNAAKWRKLGKISRTSTKAKLQTELTQLEKEYTELQKTTSDEWKERIKEISKRWREIQNLLKKEVKQWEATSLAMWDEKIEKINSNNDILDENKSNII